MNKKVILLIGVLLAGCAYPVKETKVVDDRPTVAFTDASPTAEVFVDGLAMGLAAKYDGKPNTLLLLRGPHQIEVREGQISLLKEKVFLGEGTLKVFKIGGGNETN